MKITFIVAAVAIALVAAAVYGETAIGRLSEQNDVPFAAVNAQQEQNNSVSVAVAQHKAAAQVEFIQFDAEVIMEDNKEQLVQEYGDELAEYVFENDKTYILFLLNNHRIDLGAFDYQELSRLDGKVAEQWQPFSDALGGHHIAGILTFEKNTKPTVLAISGLPVGDVELRFGEK